VPDLQAAEELDTGRKPITVAGLAYRFASHISSVPEPDLGAWFFARDMPGAHVMGGKVIGCARIVNPSVETRCYDGAPPGHGGTGRGAVAVSPR